MILLLIVIILLIAVLPRWLIVWAGAIIQAARSAWPSS